MLLLAVNGTLMRGFELNEHLLDIGATFVKVTHTAPLYRMWSIKDRYPGMMRTGDGGSKIEVELWELDASGLVQILEEEPPGLVVGRLRVEDELQEILGVLAEPYLVKGQVEITQYGGWRAYLGREDNFD